MRKSISVDNVVPATSGYVKEMPVTRPSSRAVYSLYADTRTKAGERPLPPSPTKTTHRDPIQEENSGNVR